MLSILMYEDVVTRGDIAGGIGGQTGRFVGAGLGGALGGAIAGAALGGPLGIPAGVLLGTRIGVPLGGQIGKLIGRNVVDNSSAPADFSKASHRIGYLAKANTDPGAAVGDFIIPGLGTVYGGLKNAISDDGAKRLGYDTIGRTAQGVGGFIPVVKELMPFMGAFKPSKTPANR